MKKNNPYFHRILLAALCTALTALCSCTGNTDIDSISGNGNSPAPGTPLEVRTTVAPFQSPDASTSPATRAAIDNISTKFQTGDAIGLICFRSGATGQYISEDISNLKLVFSGTDGVGTWKTEDGGDPLYYTDAVNYLAYYPYMPDLNLTGITDAVAAQTAIATAFDNDPRVARQAQPANFAACDLMIAQNTSQESAGGTHTLTLQFQHQCVLLIVKPMRKSTCIPKAGVTSYNYHSQAVTWGIDDNLEEIVDAEFGNYRMEIMANQACKMADGSYALLLPAHIFVDEIIPGSGVYAKEIMFEYTTGGKTVSSQGPTHDNSAEYFAAGTCHVLEVHNEGAALSGTAERALQPGDFVLKQNNKLVIYPGDGAVDAATGTIPDAADAVGIVVTTDSERMTDQGCIDKGWTNAYAMTLRNTTYVDYFYLEWASTNLDLVFLPQISMDGAENDMNGYSVSKTVAARDDYSNFPAFYEQLDYDLKWDNSYADNCSPLFVPSVGQWFDVFTNLFGLSPNDFATKESNAWKTSDAQRNEIFTKANSLFGKLGITFLPANKYDLFWCSSQGSDSNKAWQVAIESSSSSRPTEISEQSKGYTGNVRPFFAF